MLLGRASGREGGSSEGRLRRANQRPRRSKSGKRWRGGTCAVVEERVHVVGDDMTWQSRYNDIVSSSITTYRGREGGRDGESQR